MNQQRSPVFNPYSSQQIEFPVQKDMVKFSRQTAVIDFIQNQIVQLIDQRNASYQNLCPEAEKLLSLEFYDLVQNYNYESILLVKEQTIHKALCFDLQKNIKLIEANELDQIDFDLTEIQGELNELALQLSTIVTSQHIEEKQAGKKDLDEEYSTSSGEHSIQELLSSLGIK